ncbi:MAG: hypothetical protein ACFE95_06860 [Candidatus Hodarchaeota archaeon]
MQLYLGVVPGIFPWLKEWAIHKEMVKRKAGIVFSYWSFRKYIKQIVAKGIHGFFSYDGPIMIDSGAYSSFNTGINIHVKDYCAFLSKIDIQNGDIVINLDEVGNSLKSKENWTYLTEKFDFPILPVIHFPEIKEFYSDELYLGLGGMVPAFKINQAGSIYDVLFWIIDRNLKSKKKFHGFGVGSPYHQILFQDLLYSADWIGWRRNAAVCSCYTPEGSRYINEARKKIKKEKALSLELFEQYTPPFIHTYEMLYRPGTEGWNYRALWNVWWFLLAGDYKKQMESSKYIISIKKRIHQRMLKAEISNLQSSVFTKDPS